MRIGFFNVRQGYEWRHFHGKAITASLKDLDSVVGKLDNCLLFAVIVISVLVFISLISTSAAGVLTSAGSTVLALSWLLQATAQEFLQSLVFVFVKHPFDVGDRITVYGNTGSTLKGDDYFVKEISLLYTEFKKMEGHVVQAPNSYLNTLFILNQRRSGGLAEAVPIIWKFGTTLEQIDGVRQKLLEFVKEEKREYQPNILTELRDVTEAHSISLNIVFFFKSNWQNEGLRLQRRNKFICALMIAMQEMGVEGPNMRFPGMRESFPLYMQHIPFAAEQTGRGGHPDNPGGLGKLPTYNEASEAGNFDTNINHATIPEESEYPTSPQDGPVSVTSAFPSHQQYTLDRIRSPSGATTSTSMHQVPTSATTMRRRGPSILDTSGRNRGESIVRKPRHESIAQISRRMDFSLGMEGHASGNYAGDVFEDRQRTKPRMPQMNVTSPSSSRARVSSPSLRRPSHASDATAHTIDSAIVGGRKGYLPFGPGMINRAGTDGPRPATTHRNRFFSARRSADEAERPGRSMTLQFGEDLRNMESGLAGIQEVPTPGPSMSERRLGYGAFASSAQTNRMDPRTGFVSPIAVRMDSEDAETSSIAPERAPDGRPLFQAARLASNDFAAASASLGGTDGMTQQAQQAGILEGERIVADLQARARQRGMTNDTAGTGIDPLTTISAAAAQRRLHSTDSRVASRSRERLQTSSNTAAMTNTTSNNLQPTVSTLSTAPTEHLDTPVGEATEADVQPKDEVHTGPSAETGDLSALRGRQDLKAKASAGSQTAVGPDSKGDA
jgi:small-conductance mechanosensitive channel